MNNNTAWLTVAGAAEWIGVSEQTIRNWIADGLLPAYQMRPRSRIIIKAEDIITAMENGRISPRKSL